MALPRRGETSHQRYIADGREQIAMVEDLRRAYASLAAQQLGDLRQVEEAQRKVNTQVKEGADDVDEVGDSWDKVPGMVGKATAAVYALVSAVKAADDAMQKAFSQRAIMGNLPFSIDQAREATMGLVDDLTLTRVAVMANRFGVAKTSEEYAKLAEAASRLGLSVGQDATKSIEDLTVALARGSPLILDNLGIQLKVTQAHREYAESIGKNVDALTDEEKARAFLIVGREKALETAKNVKLSVQEEEKAWINARQQWQGIARETLPALTKEMGGLWVAVGEGGKMAKDMIPLLVAGMKAVGAALGPVLAYLKFWGEQLAAAGRIIDDLGDTFERVGDKVSKWIDDTDAGEMLNGLRQDAGLLFDQLRSDLEEQIPLVKDLRDGWADLRKEIIASGEGSIVGAMQAAVNDGMRPFLASQEEAKRKADELAAREAETAAAEAERVSVLERRAQLAEHAVNMGEAEGKTARQLEDAYQRQYEAKLAVLLATGKIAEAEQLQLDEQVRKAAAGRRGGGRGPSSADRMRAEGELQLAQWEDRLRLMEAEAELRGETEARAAEFADYRHNIAIEELRLEQQVLEVARARNSVERAKNEARREAIDREIEILEIEKQAADRAAVLEEEAEWVRQGFEWQRAKARATAEEATNVVSLEEFKLERRARQLEEEGRLAELYSVRIEQTELEKQQTLEKLALQEQLLLMEQHEVNSPEWIEQQSQLKTIAHEREIAEIQRKMDVERIAAAESKRLHDLEVKRKEQAFARSVQIGAASNNLWQKGGEIQSLIIAETIKDQERAAKAQLISQGMMAMGVGALETVKAVAAFASYNYVEGALHTAAAALAFAQGGIMLSGRVPGQHGGGAAAPVADRPSQTRDRQTSEAASVPDSVPAADRQPARVGGPRPENERGGFTLIIQGDVNGNLDDETAEKWAGTLRRVGRQNEAAVF